MVKMVVGKSYWSKRFHEEVELMDFDVSANYCHVRRDTGEIVATTCSSLICIDDVNEEA